MLSRSSEFHNLQIRPIFIQKDQSLKLLKKIFQILLVLLIVLGIALFIFIQTLKPSYEGEIAMPGIANEAKVYYDDFGIPHIYASSEEDAVKVLGYVHAQDRLWQMELLRRIAKGRLSEVFGSALLSTDKFFIALGIDDASSVTVSQLDKNSRSTQLAQAYLDGINYFIENGSTPIEYYLTGIDKSDFELRDIHNAIGYMAFSFAQGHKTDPLLTDIRNTLGADYLKDLEIEVDPNTQWIKNYRQENNNAELNSMVAQVHKALDKLPIPQFIGSNSWVLAPSKTKNGSVILANDPHIGFAQPSVWYEAHLNSPAYEKYGFYLAGIPYPLLGHDRNLAYGLTMFENDDTDFYYEKVHPTDSNQYLTGEGYKSFELVTRRIKVKDSADALLKYRKSIHGPVLSGIADQIKDEIPISMSWVYTKHENRLLESLYRLSHSRDTSEFRSSLPLLHAPGLNVMYGDAKGNIAWWATAKLYQMPPGLSTKFVLDGSSGKEEPLRFLHFDENPNAMNPPWGYVYSANNQPDSIAGMAYPGYYLSENRAKRIVHLLEQSKEWDKQGVSEMITDVVSAVNPVITENLLREVDRNSLDTTDVSLLDRLYNWDGTSDLGNSEPALFHRWIYYLLKNTFEDELGSERFSSLLKTHLLKRLIAPLTEKDNSVWWDDITTQNTKESKRDIINRSLKQALKSLYEDLGADITNWNWGRLHTLEHKHPIGEVAALRSFFNVGPFPVRGTREVINNMAFPYDSTNTFKVNSGPSTRRVIDFSDIENGLSILPTGQSGNPFSKHYDDQAEMYNKGEYRKMMMNKEEITGTSKSLLIFRPD